MPCTAISSSSVRGLSVASSRSVRSLATTYGGTPWARDRASRCARRAWKAAADQPRVLLATQQAHRRLEAEAVVHARHRAQRLAHDQRDLLRHRAVLQRLAHVALPAAVEGLRLVAEVAQDRVVATGAAFRP